MTILSGEFFGEMALFSGEPSPDFKTVQSIDYKKKAKRIVTLCYALIPIALSVIWVEFGKSEDYALNSRI